MNPWVFDVSFRELHRRNVGAVACNFWAAGYRTVVAGSFLGSLAELLAFRNLGARGRGGDRVASSGA